AVCERFLPIELIQKVVGEWAIAEEQPCTAARRAGAPLLHEGAERRNAGPRANHDNVTIRRRQRKVPIRSQLDPHALALLAALGHEIRGDPFAPAAMAFVTNGGN